MTTKYVVHLMKPPSGFASANDAVESTASKAQTATAMLQMQNVAGWNVADCCRSMEQ
jgi:hypothetical protein